MGYYIDLGAISIQQYKGMLKTADLLPSWKILENDVDTNLDKIKKQGIQNLNDLLAALKTKTKIQEFANKAGLSIEYLTVLRRVVNGYRPKPNRFIDFPEIDVQVVENLAKLGIKNTFHLYPHILTAQKRLELAKRSGISESKINRLARLTDLSRVKWVNHTFAYVLFEAGYRSAEEVANADYQEMYLRIKKLNAERKIYKGQIGEKDMLRCVDAAKALTFEVEL